jgi:archaellum biogenesis ATPase FlaH
MNNPPDPTPSNKQEESTQQNSNMEKYTLNKNNNLLKKANQASRRTLFGHKVVSIVEHSYPEGMLTERDMEKECKKLFDTMKYTEKGILGNDSIGVKLSEVETLPIEWIWQGRIPLGKITLLEGDPGVGKSLLALTIAACVSTGRPLPGSTYGWQGGVIIIAPEDSPEDTIKPRMEAVRCDPSQVHLLNTTITFDVKAMEVHERPFSLSRDLKDLEMGIIRNNAILVVIDPLMAVLGRNIDSSRDQDVREVLTPLAQLAERTGCAILIIRHLNKGNSANSLYRGAGSIGITAAARVALLVAHDPGDEQKRVFATIKNNLSKVATNLTFQIVENERGVPYIQWLGENHHTTSTLLRPGTHLSFDRQEILKALKDASGPLDTKEISEHTGLKYSSLRLILFRMQDAGEIVRLYRGKYTSPNHPSMTDKSMVMNGDTNETNETNATIATNSTNDLPSSE